MFMVHHKGFSVEPFNTRGDAEHHLRIVASVPGVIA